MEDKLAQQWDDTKEYLTTQEKENGKLYKALDAIDGELRAKERQLKASIEVVSQQMDAEKLKNGQARQGIKT